MCWDTEGGSDIYRQTSGNLNVNLSYVDGRALDRVGCLENEEQLIGNNVPTYIHTIEQIILLKIWYIFI